MSDELKMALWVYGSLWAVFLLGVLKSMALTNGHWANRLARAIAFRVGWTPLYWDDEETDPDWKGRVWTFRYDDIDAVMSRPIHSGMSVAPPWAKRHWVRNEHVKAMLEHREEKARLLKRTRKPQDPKGGKP